MSFTVEVDDDDGGITVPSTTFTVQITGLYILTAEVIYDTNATGSRIANLKVNGSQVSTGRIAASPTFPTNVACSTSVKLTAGDTVTLGALQTSGGALDIGGTLTATRL